ncbi:MAG TPA: hypothetical protein VFB38_02280 [Chthonomonadaceae bacterium]|nr:hypothetical protein [Chthonomonadaceae bacterium]
MQTLFPQPKTAAEALRQANILARASYLEEQGYRFVQRTRLNLYGVYKPGNAGPHSDYVVDRTPGHEICTCKGFKNDGDCKHRLFLVIEEEMMKDLAFRCGVEW